MFRPIVVHERFLPVIENGCQELLADLEVEGLLFDYIHFYGDYDHHHVGHDWYKRCARSESARYAFLDLCAELSGSPISTD